MRSKRFLLLAGIGLLLGGVVGAVEWMKLALRPTEPSRAFYFHLSRPQKLSPVLRMLGGKGVVREPSAMEILAWVQRRPQTVRAGTYLVHGGETPDELFASLASAIHQSVRLPETNWARRDANLLQRAQVCSAKEYLSLVKEPGQFSSFVDFKLPATTLEGYLFPDTYDLPPLTGARAVIDRQLRAFDQKVAHRIGVNQVSEELICKASLVEMEAGADEDRPMIAGVIENRLKLGMPLQIDAGILYALGKWRRLYFKDYKNVISPYNLYLHKGLPPTPICSPSLKSILSALHPAVHDYLYYVALPNGHSLFARTPAEHEHNIKRRKLELAKYAKQRKLLKSLVTGASQPDRTTPATR